MALEAPQRPHRSQPADELIDRQAAADGDGQQKQRLRKGGQGPGLHQVDGDDQQGLVDEVAGEDGVGQIAQRRAVGAPQPEAAVAEDGGDGQPLVGRIDETLGYPEQEPPVRMGGQGHQRDQHDQGPGQRRLAPAFKVGPDRLAHGHGEAEQEDGQRDGVVVPVHRQLVGDPEDREQDQPHQRKVGEGDDQDAPAGQMPLQQTLQPRQPCGSRQQGDGGEGVDADIEHEPQVVQRDPQQLRRTEAVQPPADEAARPPALVQRLQPRLGRHQEENTEEEGRNQPRQSRPCGLLR